MVKSRIIGPLSLLFGVAGCCCVIAIVALSLVPQAQRLGTGMSGKHEHFLAYGVTSVFLVLSTGRRGRWVVPLGLALLAFVLEALQTLAPGRHPRISDALVGAVAAALGGVVAALVGTQMRVAADRKD